MLRRFLQRAVFMNEMAGEGGEGGAAGAAGAEAAAAAPEFTASLEFSSTSQTHEEAAAAAATSALTSESQGWIDLCTGQCAFDKTGDAALDVALGFLAQHGYSHHHPAVQAAAKGDFG